MGSIIQSYFVEVIQIYYTGKIVKNQAVCENVEWNINFNGK